MKYTFLDELLTYDWRAKTKSGFIPDVRTMAAAQAIRIDNVDAYYWKNATRYPSFASFPNVAPPFDNYFMWVETSDMPADDGKRTDLFPHFRYGVWFLAHPVEQSISDQEIEWLSSMGTNRMALKNAGAKWTVTAFLFYQDHKKALFSCSTHARYLVDENGSILGDMHYWFDPSKVDDIAEHNSISAFDAEEFIQQMAESILAVCFMAHSLMHCKNVAFEDAELSNKEKYRATEFERKHRIPSAKWKILRIEPMTRTLSAIGGIEKNGLAKALHICRGHFKDYRNSSGLFGRNKGMYWFDQHMRGNESLGVIIKDYDVGPGESLPN